MSLLQKAAEDFKVPEILERRTLPEEYKGMRWLDDEEVVISSLLDQQGHVQRLVDFMVILTRIEKMDHRLFCLELIKSSLSNDQKLDFVQLGGYRLLRRWMKLAEENENMDELHHMLSVFEKLPFDEKAVRQAEIGKAIKKLTKFQPSSGQSATDLHARASKVMGLWTEELQKAADIAAAAAKAAAAAAAAKTAAAEALAATLVERKAVLGPTAVEAKATSNPSQQSNNMHSDQAPAAVPTVAAPKSTKLLDIIRKSEPVSLNTTSLTSSFVTSVLTSPAVNPLMSTGVKGSDKRERRQLDMEASAKKLLAVRSQQQQQQQQEVGDSEDVTAMDVVSSIPAMPLGKGGLKNKAAPRKKMSVKWADETGGLLRDVRLIEVEKIKSTVASYKSHKDLVKKEKQMEKETYFAGDGGGMIEEVMTKTTDWRKPKRLVLPIDITDNLGTPTDSTERGGQQKRQATVLEALYLDDSLIPDDPDEDVDLYLDPALKDLPSDDTSMEEEDTSQLFQVSSSSSSSGAKAMTQQQRQRQALSKPPLQELSWYAEDETPEETIPTFAQQQANAQAATMLLNMPMYAPSSSMAYGQQTQPGQNFGSFGGNVAQLPFYLQQQNQPQQSFYGAYSQQSNQQPFYSNTGNNGQTNPVDSSAYLGSVHDPQQLMRILPLSLQTLDMRLVAILAQDPSLVSSLLLGDQSVDQNNLRLLQGSSSATDYRLRLNQQSQQPQQTQQPLTQLKLQAMDVLARWGGSNSNNNNNNPVPGSGGGLQMPMVNMSQGAFGHNRNDRAGGQRHFTSKSQTPCRFFNTSKGCLQGDKCPFGHFANTNGGSATAMGSPSAAGDGERSLFAGSGQGRGGMGGRGNHRRLRK